MKNLIGLLAVIFIASSAQVFAIDCTIGQKGPAGGIIFFCDNPNHPRLGGSIGLESAPIDQASEARWCKLNKDGL